MNFKFSTSLEDGRDVTHRQNRYANSQRRMKKLNEERNGEELSDDLESLEEGKQFNENKILSIKDNGNSNSSTSSIKARTEEIDSTIKRSLYHGIFQENKTCQGPSGQYIYVPSGWCTSFKNDEFLPSIFEALGMATIPALIFLTLDCGNILPPLGLKRKAKIVSEEDMFDLIYDNPQPEEKLLFENVMLSRISSVLSSIADVSTTCDSIFLCCENYFGNQFDEMILSSLPENGVGIAVASLDFFCPEMSDEIDTCSVPLVDPIRRKIRWPDSLKIETNTSSPKNNSSNDIKQDSNDPAGLNDEAQNSRPKIFSKGFTKYLIFQNSQDRIHFITTIQSSLPVGLFCAGGSLSLLESSLKALKARMALFVFKHTLHGGHCMSSLIEYYEDMIEKKFSSPSIESRLKPESKNYYDIDEQHFKLIQGAAYNNWSSQSDSKKVLVIDPLKLPSSDLLIQIIDLMEKDPATASELGGFLTDEMAKNHAINMLHHIDALEKKMARETYTIQYLIMWLTLFVTLVSILQTDYKNHDRTYLKDVGIEQIYQYFNLISPVILGIIITIATTLNMENAWSLLAVARGKVLYSLYKFRCRVNEYSLKSEEKNKLSYRGQFMADLQTIWDSVSGIEISTPQSQVSQFQPGPQSSVVSNPRGKKNQRVKPYIAAASQIFPGDQPQVLPRPTEIHQSSPIKYNVRNISCEEYITERLLKEILRLEAETPRILFYQRFIQIGIIFASSVGTLLTANKLQLFIPALFAVAHLLHSIQTFLQLPLRSKRYNSTYTQLKKILFWWSSLSLLEQMNPENKSHLVDSVEELLLSDLEAIFKVKVNDSRNGSHKKLSPVDSHDEGAKVEHPKETKTKQEN